MFACAKENCLLVIKVLILTSPVLSFVRCVADGLIQINREAIPIRLLYLHSLGEMLAREQELVARIQRTFAIRSFWVIVLFPKLFCLGLTYPKRLMLPTRPSGKAIWYSFGMLIANAAALI